MLYLALVVCKKDIVLLDLSSVNNNKTLDQNLKAEAVTRPTALSASFSTSLKSLLYVNKWDTVLVKTTSSKDNIGMDQTWHIRWAMLNWNWTDLIGWDRWNKEQVQADWKSTEKGRGW